MKSLISNGDGVIDRKPMNPFKKLRKERALTQAEMAERLEISKMSIVRLEGGKKPAGSILWKISEYTGYPIEKVVKLAEEGNQW